MIQYVALLRGLNVGGNNIIKMTALKACFEKSGFKNVRTYIQSGNVLFESDQKNADALARKIEADVYKTFACKSRVVLRTYAQMKKIVAEAPAEWNKRTDLRCYIAFIIEPMTAAKAKKEVEVREGVDTLKVGDGVLYMTTLFAERTKSAFTRLIGKKVYQDMTMRNFNTTQKLLALMEKESS